MFITFEGIDGSGKSTQVRRLAAELTARGREVLVTREPGGTRVGDQLRRIVLDPTLSDDDLQARTQLLLFCASRAQLVSEVIRPHLDAGHIVISDRFADSTLAYQGYGQGLDVGVLRGILDFATFGLQPDVTFYIDVTPEEGMRRRRDASLFGDQLDRLDSKTFDFHQTVYDGYEQLIGDDPARWQRIDGSQTPDAVYRDIVRIVGMLTAQP